MALLLARRGNPSVRAGRTREDSSRRRWTRFRQERDAAGAFLSWAAIPPAVWLGGVGFEYFDAFLPTLDELLKEFGGFPSPEIEAGVLCGMLKALANWLPIAVDGAPWIARAREIADGTTDTSLKGDLLTFMLNFWMIRGINIAQVNSLFNPLEPLLRSKAFPRSYGSRRPRMPPCISSGWQSTTRCLEVAIRRG